MCTRGSGRIGSFRSGRRSRGGGVVVASSGTSWRWEPAYPPLLVRGLRPRAPLFGGRLPHFACQRGGVVVASAGTSWRWEPTHPPLFVRGLRPRAPLSGGRVPLVACQRGGVTVRPERLREDGSPPTRPCWCEGCALALRFLEDGCRSSPVSAEAVRGAFRRARSRRRAGKGARTIGASHVGWLRRGR